MTASRRSWVAIVPLLLLVAAALGAAPRPAAAGGTSLTYTVTLTGNGSGFYNADGGIHCVRSGGITSGTCKVTYDLSGGAIPWGNAYGADPGSCYVAGSSCNTGGLGLAGYLYPGPDQSVSMEFRLLDPVTITVKKSGTGAGTVKSTPRGINCGSDCKSDYAKSSSFTLKATAQSGSKFTKWSGGPCNGQGATCTFTVGSGPYTVTAVFTKSAGASPSPEPTEAPVTPAPTPGPTPVKPTPFPSIATIAPATAGPAPTSAPPARSAADDGGRSTLILALGSLLVIILAAGGLYAMRSRRANAAGPLPPTVPPGPPGPPAA